MVKAKHPGIGRGRGGGRPKREGARVRIAGLDLSPQAAGLLRAAVEAEHTPAWAVVERALLEALDAPADPGAATVPPEALEIAQEATAFLEGQEDRPAAVAALRRAWRWSMAMAQVDPIPNDIDETPAEISGLSSMEPGMQGGSTPRFKLKPGREIWEAPAAFLRIAEPTLNQTAIRAAHEAGTLPECFELETAQG